MKKGLRILLILVAVASFGIALSYPIRYRLEAQNSDNTLERLIAMRDAGRENVEHADESPDVTPGAMPPEFSEGIADADGTAGETTSEETAEVPQAQNGESTVSSGVAASNSAAQEPAQGGDVPAQVNAQTDPSGIDAQVTVPDSQGGQSEVTVNSNPVNAPMPSAAPGAHEGAATAAPAETPVPTPSPTPAPTVNRWERTGALAYPEKERVTLDEDLILPEYREIYEMNEDLVGWLTIPALNVDNPVVQSEDSEFYLTHDFFGEKNANGQIILDTNCDPYTPSYNLVISGHNMRSGKMFGNLVNYMYKSYWEKNKFVEFDTLVERKEYVIVAAFFSADYDTDEEGFRYNADIQYGIDLKTWMRDIKENQLYETGIECDFGDEFLTLTTCNYQRKNGRFVVICRRIREGEEF